MADLKKGDTIQCHDMEDMLETDRELAKAGYFCDWLDIKEKSHIKWRLTVISVPRRSKNE